MNLDIANMIMNIGETSQGFDCGDFWTTLFGAGFGALAAFGLNIWRENKKQEEEEKAKLLKLFYDVNIIAKTFCYYYKNIQSSINGITKEITPFQTPILLGDVDNDINDYGFLTKKAPKLYEILTLMQNDILLLLNYNDNFEQLETNNQDEILNWLLFINAHIPKTVAKIFVALQNINLYLNRYYKTENLIKNEVCNSYIRIKKILNEYKKQYQKIVNSKNPCDIFTERPLGNEEVETYKIDLNYINEVLDTWVMDFGLNRKQKEIIETEIVEQEKAKWEAPENDL